MTLGESPKGNGVPPELFNNGLPRENRNSKYFGIKFFSGNPLPGRDTILPALNTVTPSQLREDKKVWRPEETLEAAQPFFRDGKVNIVGDPQSGKGTILFGLSEICDIFGWGYTFIDGHHQDAPAYEVVAAIREADTKGVPIFYDSFDYLFARGKLRITSLPTQADRTARIIDALDRVSVPVAVTSHDEGWAAEFLNTDFRGQFREKLDKYPTYEIPLNFKSDDSIRRFLLDHELDAKLVDQLLLLSQNPQVIDRLVHLFGDKSKVQTVFDATKNYPVLKELVRDRKDETQTYLEGLSSGDSSKDIDELAQVILESEHKRRHLTKLRKLKGK